MRNLENLCLIGALALLASCSVPPQSAYESTTGSANAVVVKLGTDAAGETCTQDAGSGAASASVYCGSWQQPSARIAAADNPDNSPLTELATNSAWRLSIDQRMTCAAPEALTILGSPGVILNCKQLPGGWPQLALVASSGGKIWYADGVASSLPVMERGIGVLSGQISADAAAATAADVGLEAQRLAAASFSSNDMGQYQLLARAANTANLAGDYAQAELAYRAVAALQVRVQGANSPALARTLAGEALQISDQGHCAEAETVLQRAQALAAAPDQTDLSVQPLVWQYQGLHLMTCGSPADALVWLKRAEKGYEALLPADALAPALAQSLTRSSASGLQDAMDSRELLEDETTYFSIYGVIETRRAEAGALRRMGQFAAAATEARSAGDLLAWRGLDDDPKLAARVYRTEAIEYEANGQTAKTLALLAASEQNFAEGLPGTQAYAETALLLAKRQAAAGNSPAALATCRDAIGVLRDAELGVDPAALEPCLELMASQATGVDADAMHTEMFEASELAQDSTTSLEIAKASARLAENARDPRVAALIRSRDEDVAALGELNGTRDEEASTGKVDPGLDKQIADLRAKQAATDAALQSASPNYSQLVQRQVSADDVMKLLHPGEAFVATVLSPDAGWTFLLRDGRVTVAPIMGGETKVAALVARIRSSLDADQEPPPPFDTAAAAELYTTVLGGVASGLDGATSMTVVPSGPLLSVPFGLLLTGPAKPDQLAAAPWLIKQIAIAHVPAAANFVSLRRVAGKSRATSPWFGFGDFQPVSLAQATVSFPVQTCGDSAQLLAALPPLPGAQNELDAVRQIIGGGKGDELLGDNFTADAVMKTSLKSYRILHFATHALLPTDLKCQNEPALITSPPQGAHDASGAMLTASDVAGLDLDADAVLLSACNTGGPAGAAAGESLTGLARSFFYAGARALLVTHWSVNDRTTAYLVALTLAKDKADPSLGLEGALAAAQRSMLADATGDLAGQAHPFYWAPLALIGEGAGTVSAVQANDNAPPASPAPQAARAKSANVAAAPEGQNRAAANS